MSYAWRTLAGATAALALTACQGDARSEDDTASPFASMESSAAVSEQNEEAFELAEARCDWRCVIALGVATGQLSDALEQFGGLIETMPRPNDLQCWRADDDDWLLKLRCAYWSLKDDAGDESDSTGSPKPSTGSAKPSTGSSGSARPGSDDASSSDRGSASSGDSRTNDAPGLGG